MLSQFVLVLSLMTTWPDYLAKKPRVALAHATNAQIAADATFSKELLLAMAYKESRFERNTFTHAIDDKGNDKWFCGALAVTATTWEQCETFMRDDTLNYKTAMKELYKWRKFCIVKRKQRKHSLMRCTLDGYGAGWKAALNGYRYGPAVLTWSRILKQRTQRRATPSS